MVKLCMISVWWYLLWRICKIYYYWAAFQGFDTISGASSGRVQSTLLAFRLSGLSASWREERLGRAGTYLAQSSGSLRTVAIGNQVLVVPCVLTIITINIIINTPTVSGRQQHHNALKTLAQEFSFSRSWCDLWLKAIRYQLIGFTLIYIVVSSSSGVVIITRRSVVQIVLKNKEPWHLWA